MCVLSKIHNALNPETALPQKGVVMALGEAGVVTVDKRFHFTVTCDRFNIKDLHTYFVEA